MKITLELDDIKEALRFWAAAKFPQYEIAFKRDYMLSGEIDVELKERSAATGESASRALHAERKAEAAAEVEL